MMRKKTSKLLTVLLVIALVFSVMPVAYAAQIEEPATAVAGEEGGGQTEGEGGQSEGAPSESGGEQGEEAGILDAAVAANSIAAAVLAAGGEETPPEGEPETAATPQAKTITGFVVLEDDAANDINVAPGTPESEIPFPESITANLDGGEQLEIPVGAWVNTAGLYNPDTQRPYIFAPVRDSLVLPEGVILPEDAELPRLRVVVGEVAVEAVTLAVVAQPNASSTWTINDADESGSGTGWAWDTSDNTLTLYNFVFTTTAATALSLPGGSTIVLADGSTNSITSTNGGSAAASIGISVNGNLTIKGGTVGTGTLEATGGAASSTSYGLSVEFGKLTVEGGTVTGTGGESGGSRGVSVTNAGAQLVVTGGMLNGIANGQNGVNMSAGVYVLGSITASDKGFVSGKSEGGATYKFGFYSNSLTEPTVGSKKTFDEGGSEAANVTWSMTGDGGSRYSYHIDGNASSPSPHVELYGTNYEQGGGPEPADYTLYYQTSGINAGKFTSDLGGTTVVTGYTGTATPSTDYMTLLCSAPCQVANCPKHF